MHRLLILCLLVLMLACSPSKKSYAESEFLPEIEDIPMPKGFTVSDKDPLVYDTPSGRIVETTIEGIGEEEDILQFYLDTLPQLGWKQDDRGRETQQLDSLTFSFEKEDEQVDMTFKEDAAKLEVKFSLHPNE